MEPGKATDFLGKAVIETGALPIKLWLEADQLDQGALDQARDLASLPYAFRHIAIMPDSHQGYGMPIVDQEYDKALYQIGTLGGGNHFIEIQQGSDGHVWIMVHSGSRNLGFTVANHYHDVAKRLNEASGDAVPEGLAHLPETSEAFALYRDEMNYCIEFALANRQLMMERVKAAFTEVLPDVTFSHFINKPHNFAAEEEHFGESVIVHRKGATRARAGEWGMIPGSQGTRSFLVKGKGEAYSFASCSHGAGRVMSRARARKTLDFKAEVERLKQRGVLHAMRGRKDLDEAPGSYKDIDTVMRNQTDLVEVQVELAPLAVVKG